MTRREAALQNLKLVGPQATGEAHHRWRGGKHIPGSLAWANRRLGILRSGCRIHGWCPPAFTSKFLQAAYAAHGSTCSICDTPASGQRRSLDIDHDHATGQFRGFLCSRCNLTLGRLLDCPVLAERVVKYLQTVATEAAA